MERFAKNAFTDRQNAEDEH